MQDRLTEKQRVDDLREDVYAYKEIIEEQEYRKERKQSEYKPKRYEKIEKLPQILFNIPIKSSKELNLENQRILHVRIPQKIPIKLMLNSTQERKLATKVFPKLKLLQIAKDIRIPTLRPINIRTLAPSIPPNLRLELTSDISIRPVIWQKLNELTTTINPILRSIQAITYTPVIFTTHVKQVNTCIPRIRLVEEKPSFQETLRSAESEDKFDSFDEIFEFDNIIQKLGNATGTFIDKPVCIILPKLDNESYVYSVALICRELYRIRKGGRPNPRWLSEGSKEEIERYMRAGDMIFVIDDSKSKVLPDFGKIKSSSDLFECVRKSKLFDRLHELFSQSYGFIIFHIDGRWAEEFAKVIEEDAGYYIYKLIRLYPTIHSPKVKRRLASMCWGFVKVDGKNFDELFGNAEKKYYQKLEEANKDVELTHWINQDSNAGDEHEALKVIVAEALAKEMGAKNRSEIIKMLKEGKIKTEYEFEEGRADLYMELPDMKVYLEIETFYGTKDPISRKLDNETLNKYKIYKSRKDIKICVIILGLHILLFLRELLKLKRLYREEHNLNVEFYTIDVENKQLIPLQQVLRQLKQLNKVDENIIREIAKP